MGINGLVHNAEQLYISFFNSIVNGDYSSNAVLRVLKLIDKYIINDSERRFYKILPSDMILYRARMAVLNSCYDKGVRIDNSLITHGFDELNSREAPIGINSEGRNNINGVSYLYLADSPQTACSEIKSQLKSLISVAQFKLVKNISIFDLANDVTFNENDNKYENIALGYFFTKIMFSFMKPVGTKDKDIYKVTQFISDYFRKNGIAGISYRSAYNDDGINYTLFYSSDKFIRFIDSSLFIHKSSIEVFVDLNNRKELKSQSFGSEKMEANDYDIILNKLLNSFIDYNNKGKTWDFINMFVNGISNAIDNTEELTKSSNLTDEDNI